MTTPTPEAIEAAARALFDDNPVWHLVYDRPALWSEVVESAKDRYRQQARAALFAAYPLMEAKAKAEALIAFADAHRLHEPMFMDDGRTVTVGDLLREQAAEYRATIEGKDS